MVHLRKLTKVVLSIALVVCFSLECLAQAPAAGGSAAGLGQEKGKGLTGPRKQLATIVFAGLGGAILGLSTLSFYGRPQDKLSNIAIGFAFGVIGGTALVTYKAATNPSELYGEQLMLEREQLVTNAYASPQTIGAGPTVFKWNFEF